MAFEELDNNSEKILKLFQKFNTLNTSQLDVLIQDNISNYEGFLSILLKADYIQNADINHASDKTLYQDGTYSITTLGRVYFNLKLKNWIYGVFRSVIAPIVVSIITSIITTVLISKG